MKKWALFAVLLPLGVMAAWLARLVWLEATGVAVRLPVRGFDPRDLLAGHYLTYTVDYGPAGECPREVFGEENCVCLREAATGETHEANWIGPCHARPNECSLFIQGSCNYGRFEANIERFYFPETFRNQLAVVPQKSTISIVVRASGDAIVTGFQVDGVDVLDYAKAQSDAQGSPTP